MSSYVQTRLVPRLRTLHERCRLVAEVLTVLADALDELRSSLDSASEKVFIGLGVGVITAPLTGSARAGIVAALVSTTVYYFYDLVSAFRNFLEVCEEQLAAGGGSRDVLGGNGWPRPVDSGVTVGG